MKKTTVLLVLFLVIIFNAFALCAAKAVCNEVSCTEENTNEFENISFTWQLYNNYSEDNSKFSVFKALNQNINNHFNGLLLNNSMQNDVASYIEFSLLLVSIIDNSINWRERSVNSIISRIQKEILGNDPFEQQRERLKEMEILNRGYSGELNRIIY